MPICTVITVSDLHAAKPLTTALQDTFSHGSRLIKPNNAAKTLYYGISEKKSQAVVDN
jgi:hypothetical protein